MHINSQRFRIDFIFLSFLFFSLFQINLAFADANGRDGFSGLSGPITTCTECHTPGAPMPTVTLTGPAVVSVAAGSTSSFTFTMMGGPAVVGGVDIAASAGTIIDTNMAGTKISAAELVHSAPPPITGGTINYTLHWHAPMDGGTYNTFAAGLLSDGRDLANVGAVTPDTAT